MKQTPHHPTTTQYCIALCTVKRSLVLKGPPRANPHIFIRPGIYKFFDFVAARNNQNFRLKLLGILLFPVTFETTPPMNLCKGRLGDHCIATSTVSHNSVYINMIVLWFTHLWRTKWVSLNIPIKKPPNSLIWFSLQAQYQVKYKIYCFKSSQNCRW